MILKLIKFSFFVIFLIGMNKLLQRLPDSSREEVRNQAIVLIQQLTSSNEEMKKTVVFNEVLQGTLNIYIYIVRSRFLLLQ